ncbi:MAG TPA: amidohydrolase family protein [Candidatus Deferrimicrobiaceae bacterium]
MARQLARLVVREMTASEPLLLVASRLVAEADTVFSPGALAVSGERVLAAGRPADAADALPGGFRRIDLPGCAILPGLVNAHTHLQIPPVGFPDEEEAAAAGSPFVAWLLRLIAWRRGANPADFGLHFRIAAAEALSFGTTAVGEIAGADLSVYDQSPLRARVYAESIGFAPEAAERAGELAVASLSRLREAAGRNPLVLPGVSPHTPYTVGGSLLRALGALAGREGVPLALHLAESPEEIEFLRSGTGPIASALFPAVGQDVSWFRGIGMPLPEYLARTGILREGALMVHNVRLRRDEIDALRAAGSRFVLCPRSNDAHGNGSPDVTHFVDSGIPFALGTDSRASVPGLSLWDEIRAAADLYRGDLGGPGLLAALFRAATVNGSAALGLPGGALAAGMPADFCVAGDPGGPDAGLLTRLIEATGGREIRATVVGGICRHGALDP